MSRKKINSVFPIIILQIFLLATATAEETHESGGQMTEKCCTYETVKPLLDYFRQVKNELEDKEIKEKKLNELNSDLMEKYHEIVRIHEKFMKEAALLDEYKNKVIKAENDLQTCQIKVDKLESVFNLQKNIIDKLTPIAKLYDKCKEEVVNKSSSLESSEVQLKQLNSTLFEKDESIRRLNANIEKITEQHQTLKLQLYESQNMLIKKDKDNQLCQAEVETLNTTLLLKTIFPSSCSPFGDSPGVHQLNVSGVGVFDVLCDSQLAGPGWIVIQQRVGGDENFIRDWATYRNGFGSLESDFFLGLEKIHRITSLQRYELYIHLVAVNGSTYNARYDDFKISDEDHRYALSLGKFSGTIVWDAMRDSENMKFLTYDSENDEYDDYFSCSDLYESGWWFKPCAHCNLNLPNWRKLSWKSINLKEVKMLIRPKGCDEEVSN